MREKLIQLGANPSSLPASLPGENVAEIISGRVRELKEQGRL
jgi:hypothetical protein